MDDGYVCQILNDDAESPPFNPHARAIPAMQSHSLDDVVRALAADDALITRARFDELVAKAANAGL